MNRTRPRKRWHVKHLGFQMELEVVRIVKELAWLSTEQRQPVIDRLSPAPLRRAVADQFDMETW